MSMSLRRLHQDHRNVNVVLALIEQQIDRTLRGLQPDMALLSAAVVYFREYFTVFHQPKEELIFGHLVGRVQNFVGEIFPLLNDHRALGYRIDELEQSIKSMNNPDNSPFRRFGEVARRFIDNQRQHLSAEERYFYPEAERVLSETQWAEVDRYLPQAEDPLSQVPPRAAFAPLVRAIKADAKDASYRRFF